MATKRAMTTSHPRWREFRDRLTGPEGCNFREEGGRWTWTCPAGENRPKAVAILRDMGFDDASVLASLDYFDRRGGFCDCEILLNVDRDDVPSW